MSEPQTVLDAALWVAREIGGNVFPVDHPALPKCAGVRTRDHDPDSCTKRGKHPAVGKFSIDATTTVRDIVAAFTAVTRNYGVETRRSHLLIIDEDTATLDSYATAIGETVPETFEVSTGRGRHLWFRVPHGIELTNATGKLPKGIDVRAGSNGYVVGPGSVHANGNTYTATWDRRPVPAPQWLLDALAPPPAAADETDEGTTEMAAVVRNLIGQEVGEHERSDRFFDIVKAAKAAGMSKAATAVALSPWCERVEKYRGRVVEEVARVWSKVTVSASDDEDKPEKKSAATLLVDIAEQLYEFGMSDSGDAYGVPRDGAKVVLLLRGGKSSLRAQLAREYRRETGKVAPQQALADALLTIEGIAQEVDGEAVLYQRVARHDGALWLDLGDQTGRAVRVTGTGWSVEDSTPVLFKRTALNSPLPEPVPGADLDELWRWLNVTKEDRPLVAAWLVAALYDAMPHPILGLFGEQGTGKTTAAKVLVMTLDPSPVPARKPPKDAESWVTAAQGSWVVGLDNLSDMPGWLSDSLCRAVTGDGDVRRKLYTDGELAVFAYRRALVVTGIDLGALNGDLADRLLSINLDVIADSDRLEEDELWPAWAQAHPRILGAVLDLAAGVAGVLPSVRLGSKPRMADFARILAAVDQVFGTAGLDRYLAKQRTLATDSLTGDPFITAIAETLAGPFTGTAGELLARVTPADEKWRAPKGWPTTARAVTQRLRRQAPPMRKAGWIATGDDGANHDKTIRWTIAAPTRARDTGISDPQDPQDPQEDDQGGSAGVAGVDSNLPLGCCGKRGPEGGPLLPACQLCSTSPTYYRGEPK